MLTVSSRTEPRGPIKPSYCMACCRYPWIAVQALYEWNYAKTTRSIHNVTGLDERLESMEKTLRELTDIVRDGEQASSRPRKHDSRFASREASHSPSEIAIYNRSVTPQPSNASSSHIRSLGCSLLSFCQDFQDTINQVHHDNGFNDSVLTGNGQDIKSLLLELFECASVGSFGELTYDGAAVVLPPKQLLSMACGLFFESQDLATDIFCKEHFWLNVERIYRRPFNAEDTAWVTCFDLIIILRLGADQSDSSSKDFLRPFLLNVIRAYTSTTMLLKPKVINVQALALMVSSNASFLGPKHPELIWHIESGRPTVFPPFHAGLYLRASLCSR